MALLPALASEARAASHPPHATQPRASTLAAARRVSVPYLALVGSPGLNFERTPTPAAEEPHLPTPAKPEPAPISETTPAVTKPASESITEEPKAPANTEPAPVDSNPTPATQVETRPERTGSPVSILPDDTLREVRPEEVLPYFQYPGGAPEPARPPTPNELPPSSATYQLK